jgi:2-C-methyl-D-erythritol 2,4-cyclodiphosphate synthase
MCRDIRIGQGYDSHRLEEGRMLILGGVSIPYEKGCVAHSDGDVLIHALCDALLGALALGNIGTHFPDYESEWKNADSKIILKKVVELIQQQEYTIHNVDSTIIIEKPKITPFVSAMQTTLAKLLHISESSVSIKPKSNEKMDAVGKEEGVVALVNVLLLKK